MAATRLDFTVKNNCDWTRSLTLYNGPGITPPWASVPAWASGVTYTLASVVTYLGDLYCASATAPTSWTSAVDFPTEASKWTKVGDDATYGASVYDLTSAVLKMNLARVDANGAITTPISRVLTLTSDNSEGAGISLVITPPATNGQVKISVPAARTKSIPAGTYGYDLNAYLTGPVVIPVLTGLITVLQGAT